MHTLDLNLIEKAVGKAALTSDKSPHATQRAELEVRNARGAEQVTTCVTLARIRAELCTHWAPEFANQVYLVKLDLKLKNNREY